MQIGHGLSTSYTLINEYNGERTVLDESSEEKDPGI